MVEIGRRKEKKTVMMKPSKNQTVIYTTFQKTKRDINISAVAGSGKTTVLLELLKFVPFGDSSLFLAFNNSIVSELKARNERDDAQIMTIHSCGWRAILQRYGGRIKMNPNKALAKTEAVLKKMPEDAGIKKKAWYFFAIPKVLDLLRCNLLMPTKDSIEWIADHYDLSLDDKDIEISIAAFELMQKDKNQFDFMDMVYQPVIDPTIKLKKFDYVFCDESQDFSSCQHEFIKRCLTRKGRLITVGDKRQAIYGFAGADADSYEKLACIRGKAIKLPLSVSYRCSKAVIREAQKIVPEISYAPNAEEGEVKEGSLQEIQFGDWILCRNLKPLVQAYLWLLKNKIKSKIRGKEIGEGILALINKVGGKTIDHLLRSLDLEKEKVFNKLKDRGVSSPKLHPKMEVLMQKIEVIETLSEEVETVKALKDMIKNIFSDDIKGILLSTIHKAKGLENNRIFFLAPELIPSKYAIQDWQIEQEQNLKYVAVTRAKKNLVYVAGNVFNEDIKTKIKI